MSACSRPSRGRATWWCAARFESGGRPVLFIGHLDVVEARRSDWSFDPFQLLEQDGYFYGRGTADMKGDDAVLVSTFLRLKRENFRPSRDMILALTSDEEGGTANGVDWLVKNHRDLIDAEFVRQCRMAAAGTSRTAGICSSPFRLPRRCSSASNWSRTIPAATARGRARTTRSTIWPEGLTRLAKFDFPVRLFDVTRASFERTAGLYPGQLGGGPQSPSCRTRTIPR